MANPFEIIFAQLFDKLQGIAENTNQAATSYGNLINSLTYQGDDSFFSSLFGNGQNVLDQIIKANGGSSSGGRYDQMLNFYQSIIAAANQGDWRQIQGALASHPGFISITPDLEKYVDNMIAQQSTLQNQAWEEQQASTNLLKAGSQLESLGLSPSGVLQTGGSNVNGVNSAANSMTNLSQQMKMQKYQQRMAMARQLLGMTSQMAAAGIYGGALGAAKSASSALTSAASHSALGALSGNNAPSKGFNRQKVLDDLEAMNVY